MSYAEKLEWGSSLSTFWNMDFETLKSLADAGIRNVEPSFYYDYYFNVLDFPKNAGRLAERAANAGVGLYSLHLPFSEFFDISTENYEAHSVTMYTNKTLIRAGAEAGIKVMVLHPSSEPISDDRRETRMRISRESIIRLNEECEKYGIKLAVENLPRLCLCRTSDEMVKLLDGTGAGVVFDTNHAIYESNVHYIDTIAAAGLKIHSLHISDYFKDENGVLDERHTLPGEGINDWNGILGALERAGYDGPLMYEISNRPRGHEGVIDAAVLAENMRKLSHYEM